MANYNDLKPAGKGHPKWWLVDASGGSGDGSHALAAHPAARTASRAGGGFRGVEGWFRGLSFKPRKKVEFGC